MKTNNLKKLLSLVLTLCLVLTLLPALTAKASAAEFTVSITLGKNMSQSSGALSQKVSGPIVPVVITADTDYCFPTNYESGLGANGITVTRDRDSQITVSGTPTKNTTLTLPDATVRSYTLTLQKNDKIASVSASGTGVTGSFPTYTVKYGTNLTVTATPVATGGDNQYKFYRWVSDAETKSTFAEYSFTWNTLGDITLKAEGVGGVKASGTATVAPANLEEDETTTVKLNGTPLNIAHSVSLVSGSTAIALTYGGIDKDYQASLPAADTTDYTVWVDGIETNIKVEGGETATVTMAKFDCAIQKDGAEWTDSGHSVELKHNGVAYPAGSYLPTSGVSYERWVDGVVFGNNLSADAATNFYTVTFKDGETAYGENTPFKPQVILSGSKATAPTATPVKAGYTFLGWNASGDKADPLFEFRADTGTISAAKPLKAVWQDNSACEARWVTNGETFYGTLTEALTNTNSGDHIYVQKNCTIPGGTLNRGVTLEMDAPGLTITNSDTLTNEGAIINSGSITGSITNYGTITNTVVSGVPSSGTLGTVTNSGSVTGGTLGSLTNSGTVRNAAITGNTTNTGTLDGCRIGSGTNIGGTVTGSTYAGNGVTFGSGAAFEGATVSLQGNGNVTAGHENDASMFAGLMDIDGAGNNRLKANVVFRGPVTYTSGGTLNLNGHNILGANGSDGTAYGNDGITPIKVTGDNVFTVNGPGSILGGNGGDATDTGNGGKGGDGVEVLVNTSVIIGEGVSVSGGNGGTGNGSGNHGGTGGTGIIGSANTDDYIIVNGTAQGGNGGPGINSATGGAGGNGVNATVVHSTNGQFTGGQPGNGRFGDPLDPNNTGGTDGTDVGKGQTAAFSWVVDFTISRMSATNSTLPANQIVPEAAGGSYSSTLSVDPAGNQYISRPEAITVKMGTKTLTAGEGKDYTYDKETGLFTLLLGNADINANISVTANGVVPNEVDVDTAEKLKDALEAEIKRINIKENVTLSANATVPPNSVVYVDEGTTLTIEGGKQLTVIGAVVVNGTFDGSQMVAPGGALLDTPDGKWSSSEDSDYITGLKGSTTYKSGSLIATTTNTGYLYIRNEWIGKVIKLEQYDRVRNLSSPEQEIDLTAVPTKPAAPSSSKFKVTQPDSAEATGKVECLPVTAPETVVTYQYSIDNGGTWNNITSGGDIQIIPQGTDVFIRFPAVADPATPASQILVIHIDVWGEPSTNPVVPVIINKADPIIIDGKEYDIGSKKVEGDTTTVTVDQTKLSEQIEKASDSVVIPINSKTDKVKAQLVVKNVEDMASKEMTFTVQTGEISYEMRAAAVDTAEILKELGADNPEDVPVTVSIERVNADRQEEVRKAVEVLGAQVVVPPVEFRVTATYGGKSVEITVFSKYVRRVIEVNKEQAAKITTAIVTEADGTVRHVPTEVFQKDGKYFARINSLTNSTYALIYNDGGFSDTEGRWYEAVVREMASRGIINGRDEKSFDGDGSITRAEFAAILVRALGLPESGESDFADVKAGAWYYGAVGTAVEYGLVNGYENGSFGPNANITRQEAMQMIFNASKVAEYTGKTAALSSFKDADSVAGWAHNAAQFNVGSGLIIGSNGNLNPTANITRAESATVILRLLQNAGLVDVRSKA